MIYVEAIIGLAVGMGIFMFGMHTMGDGLEHAAGGKMCRLIGRFTNNRFAGAGTGALATAVVHSSTAITVMVVGFTDAGVMSLNQAASVIIGANVGTTLTGLLIALNSLNVSLYLMLPVVIGVILMMTKRQKPYRAGVILSGLGLIFVGLDMMNNSIAAVSETEVFKMLFTAIGNPVLLMLIGALITAIIQSSTAVNGLIISLVVPYGASAGLNIADAVYIILGTNVGTCVTSVAAAIGTSINARRAAMFHLLFNVAGTVLFGIIFVIIGDRSLCAMLNTVFGTNVKFQLAWFNFFQNIITAAIMLPLIKPFVRLTELLVKEKGRAKKAINIGKN